MTPTVGRIVLFNSNDASLSGNGATEVPAIITRVWSDVCVNLTVFRDGAAPMFIASVTYGEEPIAPAPAAPRCQWHWMAYQKAVAAGEIEPTKHA